MLKTLMMSLGGLNWQEAILFSGDISPNQPNIVDVCPHASPLTTKNNHLGRSSRNLLLVGWEQERLVKQTVLRQ